MRTPSDASKTPKCLPNTVKSEDPVVGLFTDFTLDNKGASYVSASVREPKLRATDAATPFPTP